MIVQIARAKGKHCLDLASFLAKPLPASWRTTVLPDETQCRPAFLSQTSVAILARRTDGDVGLAPEGLVPNLVGQIGATLVDEFWGDPADRGQGMGTSLDPACTTTAGQIGKSPTELSDKTDFPEDPAIKPFDLTGGKQSSCLRKYG